MTWVASLILLIGGSITLVMIGLPVAVSFLLVNIVGAFTFFGGEGGMRQLVMNIEDSLSNFGLVSIPLFILMGELMFHMKLGQRAISAVEIWIGRVPGRLSLVSVFGGAMFSTVSGSSVATTAFLGAQLLPEMQERKYHPMMSVGPIIGSGSLAMMIPPSALAILLAALMNISAGGLLIATIIPGLLMALFYAVYLIGACVMFPHLAPRYEAVQPPLSEKLKITASGLLPILAILFMVVGLIFLGYASPTESAALGAITSAVLGWASGNMTWAAIRTSIEGTVKLSVMMLIIIGVSIAFSQILAFSGATAGLLNFITQFNLPPIALILVMMLILLVLGCFMDNLSMVMVAIPIFLPLVHAMGLDPIWFAVLLMINMDIANLTPPFGLLLFVMRGVAPPEITLKHIYAAAVPFVIIDLIILGMIIGFPELTSWLPSMMR